MLTRTTAAILLAIIAFSATSGTAVADQPQPVLFDTSGNCEACHNGLITPDGRDVSIGHDWSVSMMANSARDPYWQAAVRREMMDHPSAADAIQHECAACHMPMARYEAASAGGQGKVFEHLPVAPTASRRTALAHDGVSCTMCHQIKPDGLGTPESFTAGFEVDETLPAGERPVFGPYEIDEGRTHIMQSAARYEPVQKSHMQDAGLCGSCHTLYTHSLGPEGEHVGRLPEQMPYLEWEHSSYPGRETCQSCHMPGLEDPMAISAVLGEPRDGFSPHVFRGGNFFMMRLLNRYRDELGVTAASRDLVTAARQTVEHLQTAAATVDVEAARTGPGEIEATVQIENLAGHKLPSAYPSRRAWLHVIVRDSEGRPIFESGRLRSDGSIEGNDNDQDAALFEPHYETIDSPDEAQVYEAILADPAGAVTTGLLTAVDYAKDNRLLPHGFDKRTASADIAVHGNAVADDSFAAGGDTVRYLVAVPGADGPYRVEASLWYQPIAYRWAHNLGDYDAAETQRFLRYYRSMAAQSAVVLNRAETEVR